MGFSQERDARRVLEVLPKRFARYGLKLHPAKTRLVQFRRPHKWITRRREGPFGGNGTFDLLGFTHYWARSRRGNWVVKRKTSRKRFTRTMHVIHQWCRTHRHQKVREQHQVLVQKLRGHYAYYMVLLETQWHYATSPLRSSGRGRNGSVGARSAIISTGHALRRYWNGIRFLRRGILDPFLISWYLTTGPVSVLNWPRTHTALKLLAVIEDSSSSL